MTLRYFVVFSQILPIKQPKKRFWASVVLVKIEWFCTAFYRASMDEDNWNNSEQLSLKKNIVGNCALHIMLLVVFFHHRALHSLSQLSNSMNRGSSRALFSFLGLGWHWVCAMAFIKSTYFSRELLPIPVTYTCSLYYLWYK